MRKVTKMSLSYSYRQDSIAFDCARYISWLCLPVEPLHVIDKIRGSTGVSLIELSLSNTALEDGE